jgi:hypothetical protein
MIKTLRITSFLTAIAAGILIYYFVIPMVIGAESDERIDEILDSPTVAKKFEQTEGAKGKITAGPTSPLVEQANAFASFLSPPKPRSTTNYTRGPKPNRGPTIGPTTPKFKVFATTYFEGNPELSQALIDEPGKGRHWVRQSSMVGHLLIDQVKPGVVIVKSSEDTYELEIESSPQAAGLMRTSPTSKRITGNSSTRSYSPTYSRSASSVSRTSSRTSNNSLQTSSSQPSAREKARDDLIKKLEVLKKSSTAADRERIAELMSRFKPEKTDSTDEKTTSTAKDPNQSSSMIRGGKIDTGSVESNGKTQE